MWGYSRNPDGLFNESSICRLIAVCSVAYRVVLSTESYGQDIVFLKTPQTKKVESLLGRIISTCLNQPRYANIDALHIISGHPSMTATHRVQRLINFSRIKHLHVGSIKRIFLENENWREPGSSKDGFKSLFRVL